MIAGRVKTQAEVEAALENAGYESTEERTATGRFWRHAATGRHIQVPDPYDGMYPDFILRDLLERINGLPKHQKH